LLGERVDELASRIAGQEARAHDAAAVRALLADARECADQDRAETERVTESLRLEIGSLSGRLNELSGLRAAEMQETRRLRDDLSARLDELTARIGGQERHDAAVDPGAEDEAELWETRASAEDGVPAKQKPGKKRKKKRKRGD
jgi:TolA-binding protein